ncbi:MAG: dTMP kinase [Ignavibacteria bacterium RBG_16_36_9]|nr:MAG: dTMP kinase [Ignavibacteria bacterium RBG_16_36_9]
MMWTKREHKIFKILRKKNLSPSHEFDHLKRVANFCFDLAKRYYARREIVVAAALLHDLGRSDPKHRGAKSAAKGVELAKPVLVKCDYSLDEITLITNCIAQHDQPKLRSKLLEARILKDADFLDGFGARGILRGIMYAGETGGSVAEVMNRLSKKGRSRLDGLEFLESKRLGWRMHRLTEAFIDELKIIRELKEVSYSGKLIVFEGISGSGKDTQAVLLEKYLKSKTIPVKVVNHPTSFLKKLWTIWREEVDDRVSELFLLLADRTRMVKDEILPALQKGMVVISTRSQISSQVYQHSDEYPNSFYRYLFSFEPIADLYLYLDLTAKEALRRTDERVTKGVEKNRGFFGKKQEEQRKRYEIILRNYPNVVRVDANGNIQAIAESIKLLIEKTGIL